MLGGELGLWRALAGAGPSSAEIAARSGIRERYVREWAGAQATSGDLEYDPETDAFELPPEQAAAFADEHSPSTCSAATACLADLPADRLQD